MRLSNGSGMEINMKKPLLQTENRVRRTYRGGKALDIFLGKETQTESFTPEDWISSFTEAKNKDEIKGEGISRVIVDGKEMPITEAVSVEDFGEGRHESGVLVKLLDAGERLGIQVHPTPSFSQKYFSSPHGKTECWHILSAEKNAAVYIGFKEGITKEEWKQLFLSQDVNGMLSRLHRLEVKDGDTVLVKAGTPHAIGKGCFLLEIQEPTDYTMRVEKTTVSGDTLTPMQVHYGVGEDALFDCFIYEGLSEDEARKRFFLKPKNGCEGYTEEMYVTYDDTPCFALGVLKDGERLSPKSFVTLVVTRSGDLKIGETILKVKRGDKIFVPFGCGDVVSNKAESIVCFPPKL